eukprot:scaffold3947_cov19-Prasinocladus_malaysianus.AAC.1
MALRIGPCRPRAPLNASHSSHSCLDMIPFRRISNFTMAACHPDQRSSTQSNIACVLQYRTT